MIVLPLKCAIKYLIAISVYLTVFYTLIALILYSLTSLFLFSLGQLKFDVHMCGMEEVMQAIKKEGQDVRLLRRSLDIGLSKVLSVLEITQTR